jgi:hypothetical protein
MTSQEVLEKVAKSMVATGVYKDVDTAIRALAVEQVERKMAASQEQVQAFEQKYLHTLEEHSCLLEGNASMAEEDEWMEWKGAQVMLEAWHSALQKVLHSASKTGS